MENWHRKMGHFIKTCDYSFDDENLSRVSCPVEKCETYVLAKSTRYSFMYLLCNGRDITTDSNYVVRADLGFMSIRNLNRESSFVNYTHHGTGVSRVYLLYLKNQISPNVSKSI